MRHRRRRTFDRDAGGELEDRVDNPSKHACGSDEAANHHNKQVIA